MKTHYLKITALTPLHIGTGEDYEPTNFIVEKGMLYEFDETDFYARLSPMEKNAFNTIVSSNASDMLFQVHAFVKGHKEKAMEAAYNRVPVSKGIEEDYHRKIGKVVQMEGKAGRRVDTKKVFNQFQIARTQRLRNTHEPYIPGSSFKGALATAWQEWLFHNDKTRWEKEFKGLRNPTFSPMKNLLVADTEPMRASFSIGYALNKERFEDDEQGPKNKLEVVEAGAILYTTISFKSLEPRLEMTLEELARACNAHYKANLDSMFDENDHISEYLDPETLKRLQSLELGEEKFLVRVGKHSGARAVTLEELRKIMVKICDIRNKKEEGDDPEKRIEKLYKKSYFENTELLESLLADDALLTDKEKKEQQKFKNFAEQPEKLEKMVLDRRSTTIKCYLKSETTVWLYGEKENQESGLQPFGWILCEVVDENEYREALKARRKKNDEIVAKRREEAERKRVEAERKVAEEREKIRKKAEEEARKLAEEREKAERLAAMSPTDRLVEIHDTNELIRMMQNGEIENYEAIKVELAQKIKEILQQDPKKWEKAKQKALKRKEFIQAILEEK